MRRRSVLRRVLVLSVLGMVLPLLAALYLAHRQSMEGEARLATTLSRELLHRIDAVGDEAIAALHRLESVDEADPCSDASLELMRDIDMASRYFKAFGVVRGDRLICSSLGRHGAGIPLGPVDYVSSRNAKIRTGVDLGVGAGEKYLVFEERGFAAAVHAEALIDVFPDRPDVSLGVLAHSNGRRLSGRGDFDPRWLGHLGSAAERVFFDGHHLVSLHRSERYDVVAYVALPSDYLRMRLVTFAAVLVPIGLVLGAGIVWGVLRLARQQASLAVELRNALRRHDFELYYQPIIGLASSRIVGVEALLRWPTREGPGLQTDLFVRAAQEVGLSRQFTEYVLEELATAVPRLIAAHPDRFVSVNLASTDLQSGSIVDSLRKLVQRPGIRPSNIVVEATEHSFLDLELAKPIVSRIRALGIRVAIDDFGTGYSSLSHLANLQTDFLKIDKVFVEAVDVDAATSQVALHIIRIAQSLGLEIIGEGVESEAQAAFLRQHQVRYAQGWLFHRAMPLDRLVSLLSMQDLQEAT